jgi:hypothetical protein
VRKVEEKEIKYMNKQISEEEKRKIFEISEVSLWLDSYDDIFSDFDPRPYSQRTLSDDFLDEAKKAVKEKKTGELELRLLIPYAQRDLEKEIIIKRRLREYFRKNFLALKKERKNIEIRGSIITIIGFILLSLASIIQHSAYTTLYFLLSLLEPIGWFSCWYGLSEIFYTLREKKPEFEFFKKMSKVDISFISY